MRCILLTRDRKHSMSTKTIARLASEGFFKTLLEDIRAAGTWKAERIITSPQAANIGVKGSTGKVRYSLPPLDA
jgi:hypothetical protein